MYEIKKIRNDFPMIINNPDLVYFDNGATTFKPKAVIDVINDFYCHYTSNVERGDYHIAMLADKAYDNCRDSVSRLINCDRKEVAFMANITECLNQIAYGLSKMILKKGDTILITYNEHASNVLPWFRISKDLVLDIKYIPCDKQGNILIDELEKMMDDSVKVISIAHQSNVLGCLQPLKEIVEIGHRYNSLIVVDAAQSIGHRKIDVRELDVDFLCFSSHKMLGPDGVGVLYGKRGYLKDMEPLVLGGGMNARFDKDGNIIYKEGPERFEAGTPNIEGVIGLSKAIEYLMDIGLDNIEMHEKELRQYFVDKMKKLDNIILYNPDNISGPITFNVKDIFAQDAAGYLASKNICVRSGNHCAKILHNLIDTDQTIRASLYLYNTKEEIDYFIDEVAKINLESAIDVFL